MDKNVNPCKKRPLSLRGCKLRASAIQEQTSSVRRARLRSGLQKKPHGEDAVLRHEAVVNGLHVVLHLVGPGELLLADWAREHLPLVALVVEERVSLEAVFVFERFLYIDFGTLGALVHALVYRRIPEQIQPSDGHFRELLRRVLALRGGAASRSSFDGLAAGRSAHLGRV